MRSIRKIEDIAQDEAMAFSGFLSCLIYSTAHAKFRKLITDSWSALDEFSGQSVLILVADLPEDKPQKAPSQSQNVPDGVMQMMTAFPDFKTGSTDAMNSKLLEKFGLKKANMPYMLFFNGAEKSETLIYSFRGEDESIDDLMALFDDCKAAWSPPSDSESKNLSEYRSRKMIELEPLLNRRKFIRFISKAMNNQATSLLFGLFKR